MKLTCGIIEDLIPLYEDGACSKETKKAVEEHLRECEKCRNLVDAVKFVPTLKVQPEKQVEEKVVVKGFKKIRLRWMSSILIAIILIPICVLGWNQYKGSGVSFTNLKELYVGNAFMKQLQGGDYEKAYSYVDSVGLKKKWGALGTEKLTRFEERGPVIFNETATVLEDLGGIRDFKYIGIEYGDKGDRTQYRVIYTIELDGEKRDLDVYVSDDGIEYLSCEGSFKEDALAYFCMWDDWLWEDLAGRYYDFETNQYVEK